MRALERAIDAAQTAISLDELGDQFVPLVQDAVGGSGALLFEFADDGRPRGMAGSLAPHLATYNATLFGADPLQSALLAVNPAMTTLALEDVLDIARLRATPAFNEFYRPLGVERLLGVWPTNERFGAPGMVGMIVGRPLTDPAFGARERRVFERVLPALRAVIVRDRKRRSRERERELETVALRHALPRPTFVLDRRGEIIWMSTSARAVLDDVLRVQLRDAARGCVRGAIEARTERLASGARVVVATIRDVQAGVEELLAKARAHGLTRAEASVLDHIARGLDNRSIATELCVSEATVKTHVRQVLVKLGVENRTQAALLAHGLLPRPSVED